MHVIEEHYTPDRFFRFAITRSEDGDISLGFDGYPSHTHGDILASHSNLPMEKAIRDYVDSLLTGRSFIGIGRVADKIRDVWVTDEPYPDKYKPDDESIEFRYWDGRPAP